MYTAIVVGYDESSSSKAAVREASLRIKKRGGKLFLVHAVYSDREEFSVLPSHLDKRIEMGSNLCLEAKKGIQNEFGLNGNIESCVCEGEPHSVIVETADTKSADLITLGTYGRKGLKRLLMGSVTSQVILQSPCDVLVVKHPSREYSGSYRSLLVAFDASESSLTALSRACELAQNDGAEVSVIYVIPRYEEMMDFFKTETIKQALYQEAEKIVEGARKKAAEMGVRIKAVVQEGHAGEKIIEIGNTLKNDLIVMGTHGWGGVDKAIMGSTAERVIAKASSPVLIVK